MILSDGEIRGAIKKHLITIDPEPTEKQYTTSAVDLLLGPQIFRLKSTEEIQSEHPQGVTVSLEVDPSTIKIGELLQKYAVPLPQEPAGYFVLRPNTFALSTTNEYIELPKKSKIAARVEGRSTLARLGLTIHMTAPTIHCGFPGHIILEMYNFGAYPLRLRPGMAICQLILERLAKIPKTDIKTSFVGQKTVF
jgi:dCTP deaminase